MKWPESVPYTMPINMRPYVDMHVHSTASDGTFTPTALVEYAEQLGLYAFVLSDHDTVSGLPEAMQAAVGKEVRVIPGIELSASYHGADIQILGININYENPAFLAKLTDFQKSRQLRNEKMMQKFADIGLPVSEDAKNRYFKDSSVTRAHFARYLLEIGIVATKDEAFDKYLRKGCPCYVPREMITPFDALEFIRLAGGHAVLAHPMFYNHLNHEELDSLVAALKDAGLRGIETIYSTNTPAEESFTRALAKKYDLKITGGSDFHGSNKPDIDLMVGRGNLRIPRELLEDLITLP